ncbi:Clp protease [Mycobacterium hodleri]|uniref:Clp protease N-terminal domain-containing protein n=1 Tax=Mycolicibacterium hodleri TaxID=49897 RepID=UPI0021F2B251|nr:Clp protease N-terminal domain-containing protein [Mycolicibacterium hodleri]MCV7136150.1 Clp protease [Mycolicibacterium hodleri]
MTYQHLDADANRVLATAQREARALGHSYVGVEHILLALTAEADVLETLGYSPTEIRSHVETIVGYGGCASPSGELPMSGRARRLVVELGPRQALARGGQRVSVADLGAAVLRDHDVVAALLPRTSL